MDVLRLRYSSTAEQLVRDSPGKKHVSFKAHSEGLSKRQGHPGKQALGLDSKSTASRGTGERGGVDNRPGAVKLAW